jgi:magnesium transporter
LDAYLSGVSNRLNDVMKVLTIFASIFIPLTFVAGIYGMNFRYMPELEWKYGYFAALGAMAVIGLSLLAFFKRKNWL